MVKSQKHKEDNTQEKPGKCDTVVDQDLVNTIAQRVSELINMKLEQIIANQDNKIKQCEEKINKLETENANLNKRLEYLEQKSKSNVIRIFGIEESTGENTESLILELFNKNLKLSLNSNSILNTYRIKKRVFQSYNRGEEEIPEKETQETAKKSPAILVEFTNAKDRQLVLGNRHLLKSTDIFISEELTRHNMTIFKAARERFGKRQVWVKNTKVFAKDKHGKLLKFTSLEDIAKSSP